MLADCGLRAVSVQQVRAAVGAKSDELCFSMGSHWSAVILDLVMGLLRDEDTVVRCETLTALPRVSAALVGMPRAVADKFIETPNSAMDRAPPGESSQSGSATTKTMRKIYDSLLPCVVSLQTDTNIRTRTILGGVLADMLNLICCLEADQMGREAADRLQKMVVPVMINLLADPDPQVATAILSRLSPLSGRTLNAWTAMIFTPDHLTSLMQSLETLSRSPSWRTRQAVSCVLPLLVTTCRTVESRERAADLVGPLVGDPVFEVRKTSSYCICRAAACDFVELNGDLTLDGQPVQDMGRMWLDAVVLPQLETMRTSTKYNDRIIALHMIATLLSERLIGEDDVRCDILLQLALTLANDAVPNVRLALARALLEVTPLMVHKLQGRAAIARELEQVVVRLADDKDRDTKYFASLIVEKLAAARS
jgi:serine/threonine-protein phosphatase 2A regulatory subunit A